MQGNSKVNDDLETRTNLEDADDERPSKSATDQVKKPDSQIEEPVEKINDEVPVWFTFLPRIKIHSKFLFRLRFFSTLMKNLNSSH